jgi:hypothetical protein
MELNCVVSVVAFRISLKAGLDDCTGTAMRLNPLPDQVPGRSARNPSGDSTVFCGAAARRGSEMDGDDAASDIIR